VYQLFVAEVEPADEEVQLVMQMTLEGIKAQERDPFTAYANRVRELNYGNSYYFKVYASTLAKEICIEIQFKKPVHSFTNSLF
jgi:predicted Zn-dependent peptidase